MNTDNMLVVENVCKAYKGDLLKRLSDKIKKKDQYNSVDCVNLTIAKGEIMGILGANGAGKSTLIKLICGLLPTDSGSITINGFDMKKERTKALASVGAVIENPAFFPNLSGRKNLEYYSSLRGGVSGKRIDDIVEVVGLTSKINAKTITYSLGMKQRLGIALAIINNPSFLILDEPLNGLDPSAILDTRELLFTLKQKYGTTIFISSHILSELQEVSDRIAVMSHGKIVSVLSKADILSYDGKVVVKIICNDALKAATLLQEGYTCKTKIIDNELFVETVENFVPEMNKTLILNDIHVSSVAIKKRSLEELYKEAFRE